MNTHEAACYPACKRRPVGLRDLSGDILRSTAWWLQPRDRLSLALTCKHMLQETWGSFAEDELTKRFPFESRLRCQLSVFLSKSGVTRDDLSLEQCSIQNHLRLVPERSRVQHCYVAVSESGRFVAALTYDNILRVFDVRTGQLSAERFVGHICGVCIWDSQRGRQVRPECLLSQYRSYEEENGLDVEVGFGLSTDSSHLYLSCKDKAFVFELNSVGDFASDAELDIRSARRLLRETQFVGGACAISPDNKTLAWIIFAGSPVDAYVSLWDVQSSTCFEAVLLAPIHPRQRNSLGWARVQYTHSGKYIVGVVNTAKKETRTVRRDAEFHNVQMSRFHFSLLEVHRDGHLVSASARRRWVQRQDGAFLTTLHSYVEWMELDSEAYPAGLSAALIKLCRTATQESHCTRTTHHRQIHRTVSVSGIHFNSLHSCPSESLYNTLAFGNGRGWRNNWFVSKHPLYSVHISEDASRALVCVMPHKNMLFRAVSRGDTGLIQMCRVGGNMDFCSEDRLGIPNRSFAFKGMPHKQGFASTSAFSSNGRWLAGITLKDDWCVLCVRNITFKESTGRPV